MKPIKSTLDEKRVVLKALVMLCEYFEDKLKHGEMESYEEIMEYDIAKRAINKLNHNIKVESKEVIAGE